MEKMKIMMLDYDYQLIVIFFFITRKFWDETCNFSNPKLCNTSFVLNVIQVYDS